MSLFQISCLITFIVSILFGFFVWLNNKKGKLNFYWFLTSVFIGIWSLGFFGVVSAKDSVIAWYAQYFLDIAGILIPVAFLNFSLELINKSKKLKILKHLSWILGFVLIVINFFSLFKKGMVPYLGFDYWVNPGPLYFLFPLFFSILSLITFFLLVHSEKEESDKIKKSQIKFVIWAQIFGFGGGVTNFFPQLFSIYPFGNYLVMLYVVFISYAILKHHLFNVKVLATELFTLVISIILIARTLLSRDIQEILINAVVLIFVSIFGILLIRSVLKEVEQRKKLEELTKQIQKAYEVEKKARKELERLDEAKTQFMIATQHHLRTPLTVIRGYLDLLITGNYGKMPAKMKVVISKIQLSSNRLIRVVNEFLDVSQFQLGKEVVTVHPGVDLEPIFAEIMEELKFEADNKKLYLRLEKDKKLPKVIADSERLKIALFNFIDNAIKYTTTGGVTINLSQSNKKLNIMIKDTGIGIAKDDLKTMFSRVFERGKDAKEVHGTGRGIGLYIAGHIVKAHKGNVWVESEGKGKGSTFHIEIPIDSSKS